MSSSPSDLNLGPGPAVIAFDIGGTDTKSVFVRSNGEASTVRRTRTARSAAKPSEAILGAVADVLPGLIGELGEAPAALGLSVPGLVDEDRGIGLFSANLRWRDVPFRDLATKRFGLPVAFGHDVRAAGDAEVRLGAARGYRDVVTLAIGTGIAGAIVVNGHPYAASGFAGELGHTLADPNGEICPCGARGCLETIASAGAIARRYREHAGLEVDGARGVLAAMHNGDAVARDVWDQAITALGDHIARLAAVIAPEAVVIGGGLAEAGDDLFVPLRRHIDDRLSFHRRPVLVKAQLGEHAGALGTALAARDLVEATR